MNFQEEAMKTSFDLVFFCLISGILSLPHHQENAPYSNNEVQRSDHFQISDSTNDIAVSVLQYFRNNETNLVFSPFGYSVLLAILAEGAMGKTKEELSNILHLPSNPETYRYAFKSTLDRFRGKDAPDFKNYFYVYKNFTVNEEYRTTLLRHYNTDVRSVEGPEDDYDPPTTTSAAAAATITAEEQATDLIAEESISNSSTIIPHASSEAPFSPETTSALTEATSAPSEITSDGYSNFVTGGTEKTKDEKERVMRLAKRYLGVHLEDKPKNEISGFSANGLNAKLKREFLSRMLIFNGLYYKGKWKYPFQCKEGADDVFYLSESNKTQVKMLYAVGTYKAAFLQELDSTVLSIPYRGGRYTFLIVLPAERNGLPKLLDNLGTFNVEKIRSTLENKYLQIAIPPFYIETYSYPKDALKKLGVETTFTEEADFSAISKDGKLFLDEFVQLVTINVNEESASPATFTIGNLETRSIADKFNVDHPFVFFIVDQKENMIISSGKVLKPELERDQ